MIYFLQRIRNKKKQKTLKYDPVYQRQHQRAALDVIVEQMCTNAFIIQGSAGVGRWEHVAKSLAVGALISWQTMAEQIRGVSRQRVATRRD